MSSESKPSTSNPLFTFFALYLTTLFSLDTWAAARGSPYRDPSATAYNRPANMTPSPDSYQGGMHGQGRYGSGGGGSDRSGRGTARLPATRDSRPAMRIGANAACGACQM